jgi:hypothetical protein
MNGVCLHTATGASVYCLDSAKKWKPMFDPNKVKIQLFQNGTIVYQQDGGENDNRQSLLLKKDASVQRHESESHAKYAEITHGDKVHLLKFRQETECSQFVVKASKFVDMAQPERNIPKCEWEHHYLCLYRTLDTYTFNGMYTVLACYILCELCMSLVMHYF